MPESHPGMGGKITTKPGAPFMPESHPGMSGKITTKSGAPFMPEPHPGMSGKITTKPGAPFMPEDGVPEPSALDPQHSVVEALTAAAQTSAAEALADAVWTFADSEVLIQTTLSTNMLLAVFNPEADKIARAVLREAGILKLTLLPAAAPAAKKPRPARTGSIQAKALEHPMVQQAQKLFSADLQTVIDLREPD
jgi:hypothetical protein